MSSTASLIAALALLGFALLYAFRASGMTRFMIADRLGAIAESVGLLTLFTVLRIATGWAGVPIFLWISAVIAAAAGVAALVLRSGNLPWVRPRKRRWMRMARLSCAALICGVVLWLGAIAFTG
ncbi:MAG: hypothetical protein ACTJGT_02005 [Microbacteriaceae bacterium]